MNEPKPRQGWKAFLTPGWVLTAVVVLVFTYFAFTFLGPWQLTKGEKKAEFNNRLKEAMQHDPVPVADVLPRDGSSAGINKEWTHVQLQGQFVPSAEVLLRNRPVDSSPAFQVLTPFLSDAGQMVLVNRGWAPPVNGADVPDLPAAPSQRITLTGYVRMSEATPATAPIKNQGYTQVSGISTQEIGRTMQQQLDAARKDSSSPRRQEAQAGSAALPGQQVSPAQEDSQKQPLTSEYVQLDEMSVQQVNDDDGSEAMLHAIPLPQLDNGPHLSYGIQWITFGIAAPAALIWFAYAEIRERRREAQEIAEAEAQLRQKAGSSTSGTSTDDAGTGSQTSTDAEASRAPARTPRSMTPQQRVDKAKNLETDGQGRPTSDVEEAVQDNSAQRKLAERYGGTRNRFEERRLEKRGERF